MLKIASFVGAILLLCASVEAKVLYVDRAIGSDSRTYDQNSATAPWATIGRAAWGSTNRSAPNANEAARAGDVVIVAAGTYSTAGTNVRYDPAYNPVNQGAAGNPIVFEAQGTVVLTLSSSRGPVIGAHERNYITWRGFTINEAQAPTLADTGPVVLSNAVGTVIEGCTIDGNGDPGFGDNHVGVRLQWASRSTVRSNRITNFRTSVVNGGNGAGIQVYFSGDCVFEHNEIYDSGSGIFLKAPADEVQGTGFVDQFTIRYNRIARTNYGIAVHRSPNSAARPARIYQNIVTDSSIGIRIWAFDLGPTDPTNSKIVNNTFHANAVALHVNGSLMANAGHIFWNNIVTSSSDYAINSTIASSFVDARLDVEHNAYWGFGRFAILGSTEHTFASFKTATGQDSASPASVNVDPLYTNASAGDFRLGSSSPVRNVGVDILDLDGDGSVVDIVPLGAYITGSEIIGRGGGAGPPPPPSAPAAPTSLRITG